MALRRRVIVGLLQLTGGQAAVQLLSFIRNVAIARIVGPEQFGISLTFALIISFLELAGDLSWDKFIVQDKSGDEPRCQATIHLFMLVRGAVFSLGLLVFAGVVVELLGVPKELKWAYALLALVPLFAGALHLDVKRFQRQLQYFPDVVSQLGGGVAALIVGISLAFELGDFRAMLFAIITRYVVWVLLSHILAHRRYELYFSHEIGGRAWTFGWPLLLNGFGLFLASQGDRALVAKALGMQSLGIYGAVGIITFAIDLFIVRTMTSIGLPILSKHQDSKKSFDTTYRTISTLVILVVLLVLVVMFTVLPSIIPFVFGESYEIPRFLIFWLVVVSSFRILRGLANVAALACGRSIIVMYSNAIRAFGLIFALAAVALGGDIVEVATAQAFSELIALGLVFYLVYIQLRTSLRVICFGFVVILSMVISFAYLEYSYADIDFMWWALWHVIVGAVGLLGFMLLSRESRLLIYSTFYLGFNKRKPTKDSPL